MICVDVNQTKSDILGKITVWWITFICIKVTETASSNFLLYLLYCYIVYCISNPAWVSISVFQESVLNYRLDPLGIVDGFTAEVGASGVFCPTHMTLPVEVSFYSVSDDNAPSPYMVILWGGSFIFFHRNLMCILENLNSSLQETYV